MDYSSIMSNRTELTETQIEAARERVSKLRNGDLLIIEGRRATFIKAVEGFGGIPSCHAYVRFDGNKRKTAVHGHLISTALTKND